MPTTTLILPIAAVRRDGGTQLRVNMNDDTIQDYAEAMAAGGIFPPPVVFFDGEDHWLADGFHRVAAMELLDLPEVEVEVRSGSRRDAILHAAGANAAHGLRLTNADRRGAVLVLLQDEEWYRWSDRKIARRCGVHHELVGRLKAELSGGIRQIERRVERNGTIYSLDATRIGGRPGERPASEIACALPSTEDLPEPVKIAGQGGH